MMIGVLSKSKEAMIMGRLMNLKSNWKLISVTFIPALL